MPKERILLIAVLAVLAWFVKGDLSEKGTRGGGGRSQDLEYEVPHVPVAAIALPSGEERDGRFQRDLFSPPSDTEPLAPLSLESPRLDPLASLAPPASWGPVAERMGEFLREPHRVEPMLGLLDEDAEEITEETFGGETIHAGDGLSPEELAELTATYKRRYDWIVLGSIKYGTIKNQDRFGLSERPDEPVLFETLDPATGAALLGGNEFGYGRDQVSDFGFADTVPNRLELRHRLEFQDDLAPTQYDEALGFALECIARRLEAPRALEIAEDVFQKAEKVSDGDVMAQLGLAACYEAGFEFEKTLAIYRALIAGDHPHNPRVHARLGDLLNHFRVYEEAEASYKEAVRWGATDWLARWRYGRFLMSRWRSTEAVEQLELASSREISTPETKHQRTNMRTDYGWSLLQTGRVAEAKVAFERALSLDPEHQDARAGLVSVDALLGEEQSANDVDILAEARFELLHARGLLALRSGEWVTAKESLQQAVATDPFSAHLPLRALSWMAERTGNDEEAYTFIERALEIDPTDTYTLFQRGRLLAERDDLEAAAASFQAALDRELRFPEALAAMGEVQGRMGDAPAAERYFERSLMHDPEQFDVHTRRGYNLLEMNDVAGAEAAFLEALRRDPDYPAARLGMAWCAYLGDAPHDSLTLYSDVIESRRGEGEDDPYVVYATEQIERVRDHLDKELWRDNFDRRSGSRLGNGWKVDQRQGLEIRLQDGQVVIEGMATTGGRTRLYQELPASAYVSHEMALTVDPSTGSARIGLFLARERDRAGESLTQAEIAIGRSPDGAVGYRIVRRGETDPLLVDLDYQSEWTLGQTVRIKIERHGDGSDASFSLYLDGVPVLDNERLPSLGSTSAPLRFGMVVEIEANRTAKVFVDDVEVIRRQSL